MATYNPPTENLAIFDPSVFNTADIALTQATGDARYLRFPTAQGTENLAAINVNGVANFNSTVSFNDTTLPTSAGIVPAFNDTSTKMPTTAWVQTAISSQPTPTPTLGAVLGVSNLTGSTSIDFQGGGSLTNCDTLNASGNFTLTGGAGSSLQFNSNYNTTFQSVNNFTTNSDSANITTTNSIGIVSSTSTIAITSQTGTSITSGGDLNFNASTGNYIFANMPTSSAGLAPGSLYSAGGVLMIV